MSVVLEDAIRSNAWPFIEAKKILDSLNGKAPEKGYILFETGYGPSGLPHIGTFAENARMVMVQKAFEQLSDIPTKLICFSDDMDGLRKVPSNIPHPEMVAQYMDMPLTSIPDPFGKCKSYGHYMNAKLCAFLDKFGFKYEFYSSTNCYKAGMFDEMLIRVLEKYDEIMALMLPTFRDERKTTYAPFMPICPKTGKVLQVPIEKWDAKAGTVSYKDEDGNDVEVPVTGGHCKLQWKPDFGMRWAALKVDYEMYGKDHLANSRLYSEICRILGGKPPVQFCYELFLDANGEKISKSRGNSISVDDWLKYASVESIALFMYKNPARAKRLFFDLIPKNVDEYITLNQKYHLEEDMVTRFANPVYHIHHGNVPKIETFGLTYSLLLNLTAVCNTSDKSVLWGFITKYQPKATPNTSTYLDHLTEFAIRYYNDFIQTHKSYLVVSEKHKIILHDILDMLSNISDQTEEESIQKAIYDIGMKSGYENLRYYFKDLYQILLGQNEGPRLGTFIKLYGVEETKKLVEEKLLCHTVA
ncbi:lysine--tRNA ligase [Rickettsia prowazekii]|uniref:lysine--tRNA ligase n=1 Tax=Rickettsia prowazekii TaxID=782 RepID=UPI000256BED3|nr:lysine--tRNA ligase [Rickettsia prowazekii]AFE50032.1 lysyl-tRNA synthetase [Rickettsia prowazekii str. Katsinyian]